MSSANLSNPLLPTLPAKLSERLQWGQLYGSSTALAIASAAKNYPGLILVVAEDVQSATQLEQELIFFLGQNDFPILNFPDWETLPYDIFSPLPELISQRLLTLYKLSSTRKGVLIVPVSTLLQRLPPCSYVDANSFLVSIGETIMLDDTRRRLESAGYQCVSQVMTHGEFAVRGSLLDIFPMGNPLPFRIDLFDDEVDSIRTFDPESQRSMDKVEHIEMLPAREFPLDEQGIAQFRQAYRTQIEGDPQSSIVYREVSEGNALGGLEYYLPLFFEQTASLFDYLPEQCLTIEIDHARDQSALFLQQVETRYEQRRHDVERPILKPREIYLTADELASRLNRGAAVHAERHEIASRRKGYAGYHNFSTATVPPLGLQARAAKPAAALQEFIASKPGRILFIAESAGRREMLLDTLHSFDIKPTVLDGWQGFLESDTELALAVTPLEQGLWLKDAGLIIITEAQLLGERVRQERHRKVSESDPDQIIRNLTELHIGAPVVHEDHGVGRYLGLQSLNVGGMETEFLTLEYAKGDKLYVPVSSLHLISPLLWSLSGESAAAQAGWRAVGAS